MTLFNRFVDKPVLSAVISLVILLLGLQALMSLTVRQYPEAISSTITITTPYIGADAELVSGFITSPLEQAIATAAGIDYLQSSSVQGQSRITARLELGYDPNDAVAEILTKINQVANQLPPQSENSIVTVSTGGDQAAMYLAFFSDALEPSEITDYLTRSVRPRLETLSGIQRASVQGATPLAMRVWLDPDRMAALNVTPREVRSSLARNNFLAAVGETRGSTVSFSLLANTNLDSVEAFKRLVVRESGGSLIRLDDVADVQLGQENYSSSVYFDDRPVVFIAIEISPKANLLDAVARVHALLPDIELRLPDSLHGAVVYDSTVAVQDSIDEVVSALFEALVIVTLIIALFLGALRAALVPGLAMPLAIVGSFFLMQLMGFSLNLLTLLALILAIGTVVDDGIIIVENAMRHIEAGASPDEAAKQTVTELASSIVAMNLVVLAVFAPIGFLGGFAGSLFTEFAYTVAGATLVSGIVALTLSPMMCAKLLKQNMKKNRPAQWVDNVFGKTAEIYGALLHKALQLRWWIIALGALILVSNYFLLQLAEKELAPQEDDGFLMVQAQADPNGSIDQLERWSEQLTESIKQFAAIDHAFVVNGAGPTGGNENSAFGGIVLKNWENRDITSIELQPDVQQAVGKVAGLQSVVIPPPPLPGTGGGAPIQFIVSSIDEPRVVFESAQRIQDAAIASGKFAYIQSDLKFDVAQFGIEIDRDRAADIGVNIDELGADLATMLSGAYVNFFSMDGRSYRVVPQVKRQYRLRPEQVNQYYVRAGDGSLVSASTIVTLRQTIAPRALTRFNQLNAATLSAVPAPGVTFGEAIAYLQDQAQSLPTGFVQDWAGPSRQFVGERSSSLFTIGLAIVLMYLTLAAQFNSFRDPGIMLLSVPMAVAGALLFAALGVITINIYTQIGLLALIGSIIRHGILLVEFANQKQDEEGLPRDQAIESAAQLRLRAILMTTIATVAGLIPLLMAASGPGAQSRFSISFTLGIGMVLGTVFTLFVVPALYSVVASRRDQQNRQVTAR